jgi:hypothetical protein
LTKALRPVDRAGSPPMSRAAFRHEAGRRPFFVDGPRAAGRLRGPAQSRRKVLGRAAVGAVNGRRPLRSCARLEALVTDAPVGFPMTRRAICVDGAAPT